MVLQYFTVASFASIGGTCRIQMVGEKSVF